MAVYQLRDIDDDTWRRFRARAILAGRPMRDILIEFVEAYGRGMAAPVPEAEPAPIVRLDAVTQ